MSGLGDAQKHTMVAAFDLELSAEDMAALTDAT